MHNPNFIVVMAWEGQTKPAFAQRSDMGIDREWEEVAVAAVEDAMRHADRHFEALRGFKHVDGRWVEFGHLAAEVDIDTVDATVRTATAKTQSGEHTFIIAHGTVKDVITAVEELTGETPSITISGYDRSTAHTR